MKPATRKALVYFIFAVIGMLVAFLYIRFTGPRPPGNDPDAPAKPATDVVPVHDPATPVAIPAPDVAATPATDAVPSLAGEVVTRGNQPVEGAEVAAYYADTGATRIRSDSDGRFRFVGLSENTYRVSAKADGYNEAVVASADVGSQNLVLTMEPLSIVSGRVVDGATGEVIPTCELAYLSLPPANEQHWQQLLFTDRLTWEPSNREDGRFQLDGVASWSDLAVAARAEGYQPAYATVQAIEPGGLHDNVTIALQPWPRIEGRVIAPRGEAIAGARILLGNEAVGKIELARSDERGEFVLTQPVGGEMTITAVHDDFAPHTETVAISPGNTTQVTCRLGAAAAVEGIVTKGGTPFPGATVSVMARDREPADVVSDDTGYYRIKGLPPGSVTLAASLDPNVSDPGTVLWEIVTVIEATITRVDFELPGQPATVEGQVTLDGVPLEGASVNARLARTGGSFAGSLAGSTDASGFFSITGLPAGVLEVLVTDSSNAASPTLSRRIAITDGEVSRQDFTFTLGSAISGTVSGLMDGETTEITLLPPDTEISLDSPEARLQVASMRLASTNTEGTADFAMSGVQPGAYVLVAIAYNPDRPQGTDLLDTVRLTQQAIEVIEGTPLVLDLHISGTALGG